MSVDGALRSDGARDRTAPWLVTLAALAAALGGLSIAYATTLGDMAAVWGRSRTYQYGMLVPPTLAYLLWAWRDRILAAAPRGSLLGVACAGVGGLVWLAADLAGTAEGQHIAVVGMLASVALAGLGRPAFKAALPPLALLVFLVPTGHQLLPALKALTAWFAVSGAKLAGLATVANGTQFSVAGQPYVVVDDCAGLAELLATSFLGATLGLLLFRRVWKIVLLTALAAAIAVLANGLRVNAIVFLNHWQGTVMDMTAHRGVGWWTVAVALAGLLALAYRFRDLEPEPAVDRGLPGEATARPLRATVLAGMAAAAAIALPLLWPVEPANAPARTALALPAELGSWRLTGARPDWTPRAAKADGVAAGLYSDGRRELLVFVAQAWRARSEVSGPALDLFPDGTWWSPRSGERTICHEDGCWPSRTVLLDHGNGPLAPAMRTSLCFSATKRSPRRPCCACGAPSRQWSAGRRR